MKISFLKLDEENKKNIKILEEIIIESGRKIKEGDCFKLTSEELESEIKNIMAYTHPSDKMLLKLKEVQNKKFKKFSLILFIILKDKYMNINYH